MKLTVLFLLTGIGAVFAVNSYSQTTRLSLKLNNGTIKEAFSRIEKQSEYIFFYYDNVLDVNKKVSVDVENQTVDKILDEVLKNTGDTYTISDRQIYISKMTTDSSDASTDGNQQANRGIVSGSVIDSKNGEPLAGATVNFKGQNNVSVMADSDGKFALQVPDTKNGVLVVSLIGFKSKEVEIKNQKVLMIPMEEDVTALDEVVVVGYSTQKKGSIIGSVDRIQPAQLRQPTRTLSTSLAGRLAGVVAVQGSGEPGYDGATFWIRGVNTFTGTATPLVLVDGIERSLDNIDPEEIADFTILKDATATAVYGVRGGNGVVLITTKSGSAGKPRINLRTEIGFSAPVDLPDFADGPTFMRMQNEAYRNQGRPAFYTQEQIDRTISGYDPYLYPNVNWMDELITNWNPTERINLNVSGGGESIRYFVAASVLNQNGMFKKFDEGVSFNNNITTTRYNFRTNVDANITKTTLLKLGISAILEDRNYPGEGTSTIFSYIRNTSPVFLPMTYPDPTKIPSDPFSTAGRNPYQLLARSGTTTEHRTTMQSNFSISQDLSAITPGLQAKGLFSFDSYSYGTVKRIMKPRPYRISKNAETGEYEYQDMQPTDNSYHDYLTREIGTTTMDRTVYMEAQLVYNREFGPHSVGGLFLYNQSDKQFPTESNLYSSVPRRNQGVTGRSSYSFNNKYFAEFNFGYNGSENFAKGNRYGFFPAYAVGWVPTEEPFMDFLKPAVNYLKIRLSHGTVGNDNLYDTSNNRQRFVYMSRVEQVDSNVGFGTNNGYGYGYGKGINFTYDGVASAMWEEAAKTDAGLELRFLKDFNLQFDAFYEKRTNIWTQVANISDLYGLSVTPYANVGEMENRGFDGFLEYTKSVNKDLSLNAKATFSFARNKILANGEETKKYEYQSKIGRPHNSLMGYISDGYFIDDAHVQNSPSQSALGTPKAGDIKYKDINGDNVIDEFDRVFMGYPSVPEVTYGLGLGAVYKGFDLSLLFQGADRVSFFAIPKVFEEDNRGNIYSFIVDNYWTEDNPDLNAAFPRLGIGTQSNNYANSDKWLQNGRYIRLKQAEVGYSLPTGLVKSWGIGSIRVYANGLNLFTLSPFKWWDAESKSSNGAYYPIQRVLNMGVEVKF
ncbi:MAG: TonB-dependent receptor [Prevotella sp.]|jgi:TonB-linked SusC/RagA family outer membrane protein|nr:TonB-dependent receptor [Prevotella sp.]